MINMKLFKRVISLEKGEGRILGDSVLEKIILIDILFDVIWFWKIK